MGCEVPDIEIPTAKTPTTEEIETKETRLDMSDVQGEPPKTTAEPREFVATDGKQGKKSRQAGGYLGNVASTRFTAVNQININKVKHDLELYNATYGHYPKSHQEFMEKFIPDSGMKLSELEAGDEYLYDPKDHTLKIHRPTINDDTINDDNEAP